MRLAVQLNNPFSFSQQIQISRLRSNQVTRGPYLFMSKPRPHEVGWTGKTMRELWEEDRRAEEEALKV
jgi:hypothetical protein